MPISVAFVVYGIHTDNGKTVDAYMRRSPELFHKPIDIRRILWNDPVQRTRYKCKRGENADFTQTQIAMLDDRRFYDACVHVFKQVEADMLENSICSKVVPVYCSAGDHRSHSVVEAVVNRILNACNKDDRRFNAKAFLANSCHENAVIEVICDAAVSWLNEPFCLVEPSGWGYDVADVHERAYKQLTWLESLRKLIETDGLGSGVQNDIDPINYVPFEPFPSDNKEGAPKTPPASDSRSTKSKARPGSRVEMSRSEVRRGRSSSKPAAARSKSKPGAASRQDDQGNGRRVPVPPREAPPRGRSQSRGYARASSSAYERQASRSRTPKERPWNKKHTDDRYDSRQSKPDWTKADWENTVEVVTFTCPCCQGSGEISQAYYEMFDLGNLQNEPESWKSFLMVRGCDEIAFADFVGLMNCGNWGYNEAARLIHNICKKESGGYPVDSISGYLTKSIKDCWHYYKR